MKNGQARGPAALENGTIRCKQNSYFAAVGSGTGVSASECR